MATPEFKADFAEVAKVLKDFSEKINGFGPSLGGLTSAVSKEMLNVPKVSSSSFILRQLPF